MSAFSIKRTLELNVLNVRYPAKADIRQEALNLYFQSKAASQAPKKYAILLGWGIELLILIRYPLPEAALVTEGCNLIQANLGNDQVFFKRKYI